MSIFDKQDMSVHATKDAEFCLPECTFATDYPGLWEFMARTIIEGNPRYPGKIVLFSDGKGITVCLIDRTSGQIAFHTEDAADEALRACDRALLAGETKWRPDKKAGHRR